MNRLKQWYYENIQRQVVRKVKDLPNPAARVIVWEMFDLTIPDGNGTLTFIVKALEMPASKWVLNGSLSIDPRDPTGDMVIILIKKKKNLKSVTIALSEIKRKIPEIEQKILEPQQALDFLGEFGAIVNKIQALNKGILDSLADFLR